ncbi:MAG: TSCPD domain-containing protein, partial [Chloroflexota bacterium]
VTAHDITPEWHVRMQAAFQKHTDNAVSKTCNFSHEATPEDVENAYMLAYKTGCKGVTIYRDGSKSAQVLSTGHTEKARATSAAPAGEAPAAQSATPVSVGLRPRGRPETMTGLTERVHTGHGTLYVTINFDEEGRAFEVFSNMGKAGGCDAAQLEAVSRLVSLALRSGVDPVQILDQLRGITCCPIWEGGVQIRSAPDAVALALGRHVGPMDRPVQAVDAPPVEHVGEQQRLFPLSQGHAAPVPSGHVAAHGGNGDGQAHAGLAQLTKCPDCNGALVYAEGCLMCHSCGFNKCG